MSEARSLSPDGRYAVQVDAWEAFNTHWVESPRIVELADGAVVFAFADSHWSLDECRWVEADVVEWVLRKYPGNHTPSQLVARIDCVSRTAGIGAGPQEPLDAFEAALDAQLTWR